ncbi:MAG: hypothetical protein HY594_01870 [Candidatus Omnitrophica bacterium]|nr:hypothetical protein [Candidatus Omnitrophota bacterium]
MKILVTFMAVFVLASPVDAAPEEKKPVLAARQPWEAKPPAPVPTEEPAGKIFDVPVSKGNYFFAKAVAYIFPRPWGAADLPEADREKIVWDNLILHYESYRQGIQVSDEEVDKAINQLLKDQKQSFTRQGDPAAYQQWVKDTLKEEADLLENQIRYLIAIRSLKDKVVREAQVTAGEEELQQEFLNEQNHVSGEMVTFEKKEDADAFYKKHKTPKAWEAMKKKGEHEVRPVSLMTLEAYMDLWSIPKDQMYAFHALPIGSIGEPMPFGTHWCVYRLLDKRTGDLKDFPKQRDSYVHQVEMKKKYEAMNRWVEDLKTSAKLETYIP